MSWTQSLIKLSSYEVETLQKRMKEVSERRAVVVQSLERLALDEAAETERARRDSQAGWYLVGFRDGCRARRTKLQADLAAVDQEIQGVRDALGEAFEAQKKYEQVADAAKLTLQRLAAKREAAQLDELALRRRA